MLVGDEYTQCTQHHRAPHSITVDTSNLTQFIVSPDNSTVRVGAGMKNGLFLHNLKNTGIPGIAGIVGNCPSVGTSGALFRSAPLMRST